MKKLSYREDKKLAHGHIAREGWTSDESPGSLAPEFMLLAPVLQWFLEGSYNLEWSSIGGYTILHSQVYLHLVI